MKLYVLVIPDGVEFILPNATDADREIYGCQREIGDTLLTQPRWQFVKDAIDPMVGKLMREATLRRNKKLAQA